MMEPLIKKEQGRLVCNELSRLREQLYFQSDYHTDRTDSVKHLLDTHESKDVDVDMLDVDIGVMFGEMEQSIASDTYWESYLSKKKIQNSLMNVSSDLANFRIRPRTSTPMRTKDSLNPE